MYFRAVTIFSLTLLVAPVSSVGADPADSGRVVAWRDSEEEIRQSWQLTSARLADEDLFPVFEVATLDSAAQRVLRRYLTWSDPRGRSTRTCADMGEPFDGSCLMTGRPRAKLAVGAHGNRCGLIMLVTGGRVSAYTLLVYDIAATGLTTFVLSWNPLNPDVREINSLLRQARTAHRLAEAASDLLRSAQRQLGTDTPDYVLVEG